MRTALLFSLCLLSPLAFLLPWPAFLAFMIAWGIFVVGDSPQFSALTAATAPLAAGAEAVAGSTGTRLQ